MKRKVLPAKWSIDKQSVGHWLLSPYVHKDVSKRSKSLWENSHSDGFYLLIYPVTETFAVTQDGRS